jgi:hypothetical protein
MYQQHNNQASFTKTFAGNEDDIVDGLLSILKRDRWEELKMHYETGTMTAELTELRIRDVGGQKEELPLTFALSVSWFETDKEVEVMVEVTEPEYDWTQDECDAICNSILEAMKVTLKTVS